MQEVMVKTHLIVTDVHEEYKVEWCGKIANTKPLLQNCMPVFVIIGSEERVEINTIDIRYVEDYAKRLTHPRGRQAVTTDISRIYLMQEDRSLAFMGKVTHNHVKQYQQMYDPVNKI